MENFEEMLEEYLDDEEIERKVNLDIETMDVHESENKKNINFNYLNTITISEFVNYYLGTEHDCKNLKHKGLKSFNNPYVIGISNEFAIKNPDCIRRNEIIVVIDSYGNPGTYINPKLLKKLENMEECKIVLNILNTVRIHDLANIQGLYNEYMKTIEQINELQQCYIESCDLLNQLQKNSILKEIRSYVKKAKKVKLDFEKKQSEILELNYNNFNFNEEELCITSQINEINDEQDICDNKINRQKQFVQKTKRSIVRKDD